MRTRLALLAVLILLTLAAPAWAQGDPEPDCGDFANRPEAQAALDADPSDPGGLDGAVGPARTNNGDRDDQRPDPGDGLACESYNYGPAAPRPGQASTLPLTGGRTVAEIGLAVCSLLAGGIALYVSRYQPRHSAR